MTTPVEEEEELGELPPLDGDAGEPEPPEAGDDDAAVDGDASLDDSTGEDDPVDADDLEVDDADVGWLGEATDAEGLDLGDPAIDLAVEPPVGDEAEEPGVGDEDFGLGRGPERVGLDAGDEGPLDEDEELRDEDLPALDADDAGEVDEAAPVEAGFGVEEAPGLPWAAAPWERVGAPFALGGASAVACAGAFTLAAAKAERGAWALVRLDLEGGVVAVAAAGLPVAEVRALAAQGELVVASTDGGLYASEDGGETFAAVDGLGSGVASLAAEVAEPDASEVVDAAVPAIGDRLGDARAIAGARGGVVRDQGDGVWEPFPWPGAVTALAMLDDRGTLVAASYSDGDDATALVRLDEAGIAVIVARVGATRSDPESDGRVASMAFDAARGVVWLAGGFGVLALSVG